MGVVFVLATFLYFHFFALVSRQTASLAKTAEQSVLTLSSLCLPSCMRDTVWSWFKKKIIYLFNLIKFNLYIFRYKKIYYCYIMIIPRALSRSFKSNQFISLLAYEILQSVSFANFLVVVFPTFTFLLTTSFFGLNVFCYYDYSILNLNDVVNYIPAYLSKYNYWIKKIY